MTPLYVSCGTPHVMAARALTAGLYVGHGILKPYLKEVIGRRRKATIALLQADSDPTTYFGICLIDETKMVQIFVHEAVRGKGWGRRLFQAALAVSGEKLDDLYSGLGDDIPGTSAFWKRLGVECRDDCTGVDLSLEEAVVLAEDKVVLLDRTPDKVTDDNYRALYTRELFDCNHSEESDSIRGLLTTMFREDYVAFDRVLFHLTTDSEMFISLALVRHRQDSTTRYIELQMFVAPSDRNYGLGQEFLEAVHARYPDTAVIGHYTPSSKGLFERNDVIDIKTLDLKPWATL